MDDFEQLDIDIPDYAKPDRSKASQPFSRTSHDLRKPGDLGYTRKSDRSRTKFFVEQLIRIYRHTGKSIPYRFRTSDGIKRSLDAGCFGILGPSARNLIDFELDESGYIRRVSLRETLFREYAGEMPSIIDGQDFDIDQIIDERRRALSDIIRREGAIEFRRKILGDWNACAVTGSKVMQALDAAHLHKYLGPITNHRQNGIALRADVHRLLDRDRVSFQYRSGGLFVCISGGLSGSEYWQYNGMCVILPADPSAQPDHKVVERRFRDFEIKERSNA